MSRAEDDVQVRLRTLHARVDADAARIARRHGDRLRCGRGCASCCVDDLTVSPAEACRIQRGHPELLARAAPHPAGACAFLDEDGACRIYPDRPYVCRTQGLPLRWLEERGEHGAVVEQRSICALNAEGPPLETLPEDDCWSIGPVEQELAALREQDAGGGDRVALRALFARRS